MLYGKVSESVLHRARNILSKKKYPSALRIKKVDTFTNQRTAFGIRLLPKETRVWESYFCTGGQHRAFCIKRSGDPSQSRSLRVQFLILNRSVHIHLICVSSTGRKRCQYSHICGCWQLILFLPVFWDLSIRMGFQTNSFSSSLTESGE